MVSHFGKYDTKFYSLASLSHLKVTHKKSPALSVCLAELGLGGTGGKGGFYLLNVYSSDSVATSIGFTDFLLDKRLLGFISFFNFVTWNEETSGD